MNIFNDLLVQMGAIGIMISGLGWFGYKMYSFMMKSLQDSISENKILEATFRDYLIDQAKEHHSVISENTEVHKKLLDVFVDEQRKRNHERQAFNKELVTEIRELNKSVLSHKK